MVIFLFICINLTDGMLNFYKNIIFILFYFIHKFPFHIIRIVFIFYITGAYLANFCDEDKDCPKTICLPNEVSKCVRMICHCVEG